MSAEPPLMTFPVDGRVREFHVTARLFATHSQAFPSLDVMSEYRKALGWIQSNPEKRKTVRGMPTFLFRWLNRAQDRGASNGRANGNHAPARNFTTEVNDQVDANHLARMRELKAKGKLT